MTASTRRVVIAVAVVALIALRKSDSLLNPQFWAEDGALFFIEVERYGGWGLLARPYEGYLHFLPRLIAACGGSLPLPFVPAFYAWSALIVTGLIAWWLQSPRLPLRGGAVAALALAAAPHNGEVWLTICNLQWVTAVGLFALVLARDPEGNAARTGELALLLATGLTGPFILLALPLFAARAWQRRSRWSCVLLAVAAATAAAHVPALLARALPADPPAWAPLHHLAVVGRRVVGSLFLGEVPLGELPCIALALAAPVSLGWALWHRRTVLAGGLTLLAAALLIVAATGYKVRPDTWTLSELGNGDRYFFIPKIFLLWLLAALALDSGKRVRVALIALLALPLVANAPRYFLPPAPDQHWRAACALIARGEPVWVPILPADTNILHPGRRHREK
jgi:hypothetical protein